jgi:hypothetical protein
MGFFEEQRGQVLILRAWAETSGNPRLRVRVTRVTQDRAGEPATSAVATIDGACALVRTWLEGLLQETTGSLTTHAAARPGTRPGDGSVTERAEHFFQRLSASLTEVGCDRACS